MKNFAMDQAGRLTVTEKGAQLRDPISGALMVDPAGKPVYGQRAWHVVGADQIDAMRRDGEFEEQLPLSIKNAIALDTEARDKAAL